MTTLVTHSLGDPPPAPVNHLALFETVEPAAQAIADLRALGLRDEQITVISGVPYLSRMLDRPHTPTHLGLFAIGGFLTGMLISLALNFGTPFLYPIRVGGMPYYPIPPTIVLTFELSMLGLMIGTFLGVIWESAYPVTGPQLYHPQISDGAIGVIFACPPELCVAAERAMSDLGATSVERTEAKVP